MEAELFFDFFDLLLAQAAMGLGGVAAFSPLVRAAGGLLQHPIHCPTGDKSRDCENKQRDSEQGGRNEQQAAEEISFHKVRVTF